MVVFSKYEFNNKLLGGVTLLRVTPGVTWTQLYMCVYVYIYIYIYSFFFFWVSFLVYNGFNQIEA